MRWLRPWAAANFVCVQGRCFDNWFQPPLLKHTFEAEVAYIDTHPRLECLFASFAREGTPFLED